jgi:dihydrofolate synthase / folylpolyglutamate synthase
MPRVYERIKSNFEKPKIIHVIGTNGKGTTGRFLATALYSLGFSVGHYSSPHILNFNERIWLNGSDASEEALNLAHSELLTILTKEEADSLSYFEYATFLAMLVYKDARYVVLEAGLGGERDATAAFKNELTLVTPIDMDHEAFLGDTIAEIATTKLLGVQKMAILSEQANEEVYDVAFELLRKKDKKHARAEVYIDEEDETKISIIARESSLENYLVNNLKLAIAALKYMNIPYEAKNFSNSKLFGRLSAFGDNVLLDVGHNVLAARAILKSLTGDKYVLVYNSYKDKNYKEILRILRPIVKRVEIIDVLNERIEKKEILQEALKELGIVHGRFDSIAQDEKYLVFGSFSVVEEFLRACNE